MTTHYMGREGVPTAMSAQHMSKSSDAYDVNPDTHLISGSCPTGFLMVNVASMHVIAHQSDVSTTCVPGLHNLVIRTART
jgi:hypothetical protein